MPLDPMETIRGKPRCQKVFTTRFRDRTQCGRTATDGDFCWQHGPDDTKQRATAVSDRYLAKMAKAREQNIAQTLATVEGALSKAHAPTLRARLREISTQTHVDVGLQNLLIDALHGRLP